ncbi:MAG: hypothetical protein QXX78_07445 [Nitrososphaerota archaeon]
MLLERRKEESQNESRILTESIKDIAKAFSYMLQRKYECFMFEKEIADILEKCTFDKMGKMRGIGKLVESIKEKYPSKIITKSRERKLRRDIREVIMMMNLIRKK